VTRVPWLLLVQYAEANSLPALAGISSLAPYERTVDQLTSLREKVGSYVHVSGTQGGHTLNLHRFASDGLPSLAA